MTPNAPPPKARCFNTNVSPLTLIDPTPLVCGVWSARNKACTTARRMEDHTTEPQPTRNMTILATGLTIGAIVTGGVLITF